MVERAKPVVLLAVTGVVIAAGVLVAAVIVPAWTRPGPAAEQPRETTAAPTATTTTPLLTAPIKTTMPTDGGDTSALDMVARYLAEAVNTKDKASAAFLACNTPSGGEA